MNIPILGDPAVQEFSVPVQSEDAGERLIGVLVISYGELDEANANPPSATVLEPANFQDPPREMGVRWKYGNYAPGLYPLTLVVTHEANFNLETFRPDDDFDDVAIITWWVNLGEGLPSATAGGAIPTAAEEGAF